MSVTYATVAVLLTQIIHRSYINATLMIGWTSIGGDIWQLVKWAVSFLGEEGQYCVQQAGAYISKFIFSHGESDVLVTEIEVSCLWFRCWFVEDLCMANGMFLYIKKWNISVLTLSLSMLIKEWF